MLGVRWLTVDSPDQPDAEDWGIAAVQAEHRDRGVLLDLRGALEKLEAVLADTESAGVTGVVSATEDVVSSGDTLLQSLQAVDCG